MALRILTITDRTEVSVSSFLAVLVDLGVVNSCCSVSLWLFEGVKSGLKTCSVRLRSGLCADLLSSSRFIQFSTAYFFWSSIETGQLREVSIIKALWAFKAKCLVHYDVSQKEPDMADEQVISEKSVDMFVRQFFVFCWCAEHLLRISLYSC